MKCRNMRDLAVNDTLSQVGVVLADGEAFDLDVFFEILLNTLPASFDNADFCKALQARFASLVMENRIPACGF